MRHTVRRARYSLLFVAIVWLVSYSGSGRTSEDGAGLQSQPPTDRPPPVQGFDDYWVDVVDTGEITALQVIFRSLPSTSDIAAEVVRNALETLVEEDGSRKILAMAFDTSDRALSDLQYGGSLEYDPGNGRIMTLDERRGLQATEADEGTYYIRVQESETAVAPVRNWLIAYIVFPGEPTGTDVKTAVSKEIEKLKPRGLDVNLRIYSGDKSNKITWKQIKAPNGKYMGVEYVFATGGILPSWDWD